MCHGMTWEEWQLLREQDRREDTEPRVVEVASEPEAVEAEPEREPERELIRA